MKNKKLRKELKRLRADVDRCKQRHERKGTCEDCRYLMIASGRMSNGETGEVDLCVGEVDLCVGPSTGKKIRVMLNAIRCGDYERFVKCAK